MQPYSKQPLRVGCSRPDDGARADKSVMIYIRQLSEQAEKKVITKG